MKNIIDNATVNLYLNTVGANSEAIAPSAALVPADFVIYKDGSAIQKTSTNGITVTSPFDGRVGYHKITIDTSNDTSDAGFWVAGSIYEVLLITTKTVDSVSMESLRFPDNTFGIEYGFNGAVAGDAMALTSSERVSVATAVFDRVLSKANHNIGQSAGKLLRHISDLTQMDGAISDVSPTTTGFNTNLTQADGYWNDAVLIFSDGAANAGKGTPIKTFLNTNGAITFESVDGLAVTPVNGDDFIIYATHVHPVSQIRDSVLNKVVVNNLTVEELIQYMASTLLGKLTSTAAGGGAYNLVFKDAGGTTTRISATANSDGDRTSVTLETI